MRRSACPLVLVLLCALASAEDEGDVLGALTGETALAWVKELAADAMQGRRTGFASGTRSEDWVVGKFSEFGLHPADAGGAYLEPFTFGAMAVTAPPVLKIEDRALRYGEAFIELLQTGAGTASAEVVFCGYGIERPDLGWSDYAGVDVKGRIVLVLGGVPAARAADFDVDATPGAKARAAAGKRAGGLLIVDGEVARAGAVAQDAVQRALPVLSITRAVADEILAPKGGSVAALREAADAGAAFVTGTRASLSVEGTWYPGVVGRNVLGAIRGRDPDLVEEVVLVGAQLDAFGMGLDGTIFNGADESASGLAVLTRLADVLTGERWRPKRTVVFCAFGGGAAGLLGARALAARYPFEGRVVCVLDLGAVGQGEAAIELAGGRPYPAMAKRLEDLAGAGRPGPVTFLDLARAARNARPFAVRGVPAFSLSTRGAHPGVGTPADDAAAVDARCLAAAARAAGTLLVGLGDCPDALADETALPGMLLREGPRAAPAVLRDGALPDPSDLARAGVSALIVRVPEVAGPEAAWQGLADLASRSERRYRLVREAADLGRAYRDGAVGVLPVLACRAALAADPGRARKLADLGYRALAPWTGPPRAGAAAPSLGEASRIVSACREAGVVVVLDGFPRGLQGDLAAKLEGWPAFHAVESDAADAGTPDLRHLGEGTLLLWTGTAESALSGALGAPPGAPAGAVLARDTAQLEAVLAGWAAAQPVRWAVPGSPDRLALRAALGGRLATWLRRAGR